MVEATLRIESSLIPPYPFQHQIQGIMFDTNGEYLACTVYNRIYIFSFRERKIHASFAVDARIACACFDPCGKHLFIISVNKEALVFDIGKQCLTDWSLQNPKLNKLAMMAGEIKGVQFRSDHVRHAPHTCEYTHFEMINPAVKCPWFYWLDSTAFVLVMSG